MECEMYTQWRIGTQNTHKFSIASLIYGFSCQVWRERYEILPVLFSYIDPACDIPRCFINNAKPTHVFVIFYSFTFDGRPLAHSQAKWEIRFVTTSLVFLRLGGNSIVSTANTRMTHHSWTKISHPCIGFHRVKRIFFTKFSIRDFTKNLKMAVSAPRTFSYVSTLFGYENSSTTQRWCRHVDYFSKDHR